MVVDDLVVVGAEPLFLTDYIATGKVVPEKIAAIVGGIAEGCVQAGCALVGGETAEHPGVMARRRLRHLRHRRRRRRTPTRCSAPSGCAPATSLIAHGLVRPALQRLLAGAARAARAGRPGARRDRRRSAAARWATSCSTPTRIYALDCLALAADVRRARLRPHHRRRAGRQPGAGAARRASRAVVDRATWAPQPIFDLIARDRRGRPRRAGADVQPRRRHGRGRRRPTRADDALAAARPRAACRRGVLGEVARRRSGTTAVQLAGDYAGRRRLTG